MDFSQRSKLFAEADKSAEKIQIDPDEFVRRLKSLDLENKEPLPIHIMYGQSFCEWKSIITANSVGGLGLKSTKKTPEKSRRVT